ncbi:hypothetical protein SD71_03155 [Cohnella kolymensis]|uniref:Uncharacterized protein n=1 Tax=Cohnella kolymensis TaxID=1590652 RepID=A0ABR5AAJ9_9BACL|nr:hypothetical protein [Cohnella kolymensis]KIL37615.1 hypothetical protein SD71_03155 [Cohnella kolymensis]
MRRVLTLIGVAFIAQMLIAGAVSAAYKPQNDWTINLSVPVSVPTADTAALTFTTQQAVHSTLFQATGASVDYYYIWLNVNGEPVAAIDPAKFCF